MSGLQDSDRPWYAGVTGYQWLVLLIACLGWIFDAFEGQVFVVSMHECMPALLPPGTTHDHVDFYNNLAMAAFLVGGAVGGVGFGILSDRIGRVRTMMLTILFYSGFTCLSAFSQTWWHMVSLRFFVAIGVGGEWAVASAMVAEVFPARARSTSLGHLPRVQHPGRLGGRGRRSLDRGQSLLWRRRLSLALGVRHRPAAGLAHVLDLRLAARAGAMGTGPGRGGRRPQPAHGPSARSVCARAASFHAGGPGPGDGRTGHFLGRLRAGTEPRPRVGRKRPARRLGFATQSRSAAAGPARAFRPGQNGLQADRNGGLALDQRRGGVGFDRLRTAFQPCGPPRRVSCSIAWEAWCRPCYCSRSCRKGRRGCCGRPCRCSAVLPPACTPVTPSTFPSCFPRGCAARAEAFASTAAGCWPPPSWSSTR